MIVKNDIQHMKEVFKLPYNQDQLEYWGPVNHLFADSFLTMGHTFIYQYFKSLDSRFLKSVFSSFVEMVQNVSEYNEEAFKDNYPQSFVRLRDDEGVIVIDTANCIKPEDKLYLQTIFERIFAIPEDELQQEYKTLLLKGGSLGLLMLRKLKNANVEYTLSKNELGELWLCMQLKMNYGNI